MEKLRDVVCAIAGISHEIYRQETEPQLQFYLGYRGYHGRTMHNALHFPHARGPEHVNEIPAHSPVTFLIQILFLTRNLSNVLRTQILTPSTPNIVVGDVNDDPLPDAASACDPSPAPNVAPRTDK